MVADKRGQLVQPERREIDAGGRELGILNAAEMRVREPPVPRNRVNAALPSDRAQSDDRVDRRQPGPQNDDTCLAVR